MFIVLYTKDYAAGPIGLLPAHTAYINMDQAIAGIKLDATENGDFGAENLYHIYELKETVYTTCNTEIHRVPNGAIWPEDTGKSDEELLFNKYCAGRSRSI
jgi:hypothetical protein